MRSEARRNIVWPLQLMVIASLLGPALLLAYSTYTTHRTVLQQSEERVERGLDVAQEHALKALQTVDRVFAETNEVLRDHSDDRIRAEEERLHLRLQRTQQALPHVEAIWVFDREGRPLVTSALPAVPRTLNNSDRDYFRAHAERDAGTFIGDIITARLGGLRFFVISQRRASADGSFNGVIAISVLPSHFREFYARMSRGFADSFGLIRPDGAFLARYPSVTDRPERLTSTSAFVPAVQRNPEAGFFQVVSQLDGIERRIGYRRIASYPAYVQVGIETGAIWREVRSRMMGHIAFGLPASLLLFGLSLYALRRTRSFHAEVERREAAEAALKQAQRLEAIGQLTGGVAHDFNNLLMVVNGSVERLRRYPADERQKRLLDGIQAASHRGASLTRQLLSFSRQQTHEPEAIELDRRLPTMQDMLRSSLRGDIAIDFKFAAGLWPIKVDPNEFELALLNIAVNARDAMPDGGRFTLAAQNVSLGDAAAVGLKGDFVAFSLSDTGTGIPPDLLGKVFEPFFTTKEVGRGTGLGLSQVYGFAQQSGGTAAVASEPGRGTTITLYLPRGLEGAAAEQAPPSGEALRRDGRGRILLVEDNADVAEITKANLEELGYEVVHAPDVKRALALIETERRLDLVLSDIVMPGELNGLDFARLVRQRFPQQPVLLATGYSNVAQVAADEGFPILRKPYEVATLSEAVKKTLRSRRFKVVA
jgi:two-component system NtrC family sensor kinase